MLITCQKFMSCMIDHYNRLCHIITHNMCETWGLIYSCAMRAVPTSCHVLLHMQWLPYVYMACQELLMEPFMQVKWYLSKLITSHFSNLNMKIENQNALKRILIDMYNKNKADCNENFRICAEEPIAPLYKW